MKNIVFIFKSLFDERTKLYRKYGDITIDCGAKTHDEIVAEIIRKVKY